MQRIVNTGYWINQLSREILSMRYIVGIQGKNRIRYELYQFPTDNEARDYFNKKYGTLVASIFKVFEI